MIADKHGLHFWAKGRLGGAMEAILLTIHLLVSIALVGIVLLQPSEGGALGIGGGQGGLSGLMTSRSAASALTRTTIMFGCVFFATSIALTLYAKAQRTPSAVNPISGQPVPGSLQLPSRTPIPSGDGALLPGAAAPTSGSAIPASPAATPTAPPAAAPAPAAAPPAAAPVLPPAKPGGGD